jgi:polysaccharide deacetylase family protein (PEP-CTERM system associated)
MVNILTIDVEDWFHTSALEPYIPPESWDGLESRVSVNVRRILQILADRHVSATFFVLGWVAERQPELVREIAAQGHEIASHGYRHRLVYDLAPSQFREYVRRSKQTLEDLTGRPVAGYRATSFSIVARTLWALDTLKEMGFVYDSSIYPIGHHDLYGIAGSPRYPYAHDNGLVEIPPSTLKVLGKNIPCGGGGYFRLYPYWLTRLGIQHINREGHPAMVYLHPWELDPDCYRVSQADRRTRFRQYINLRKTEPRLTRLLDDFSWGPVRDYLQNAQTERMPLSLLESTSG